MTIIATLPDTFDRFNGLAARIRVESLSAINTMASQSVSASYILDVLAKLRAIRAEMNTIAATPGIAAFAQRQVGDAYDVVAEFTAMTGALDAVIAGIVANIPKTAGNKLTVQTIDPNTGAVTEDTFSSAVTAGLRTVLQTLADTIE